MSRKAKADVSKPDVRDAALKYANEAVATLVELMRNSGSDPVRIAAARELRKANPSAVYEIRPIKLFLPADGVGAASG